MGSDDGIPGRGIPLHAEVRRTTDAPFPVMTSGCTRESKSLSVCFDVAAVEFSRSLYEANTPV
jgi:hypothetical protein